jgi:hypothetical protein
MSDGHPLIPGGYVLCARQFLERLAEAPLMDRSLRETRCCHTEQARTHAPRPPPRPQSSLTTS